MICFLLVVCILKGKKGPGIGWVERWGYLEGVRGGEPWSEYIVLKNFPIKNKNKCFWQVVTTGNISYVIAITYIP